jgi:thymidine kinase
VVLVVPAEYMPYPWHPPSAQPRGSVEVICGSMFSGKTEELVRRLRLAVLGRRRVQAFKPRIDDRHPGSRVVSHEGVEIDALVVSNSTTLESKVEIGTQVVGIDEAQFFDVGIVELVERMADDGLRVIVAGLDQDYLGRPFPPIPQLMAVAEQVTKVYAVCVVCGAPATRSQRLVDQKATILVGGSESYEPRCRSCFVRREVSR